MTQHQLIGTHNAKHGDIGWRPQKQLTNLGRVRMTVISLTTFSNVLYSLEENVWMYIKFHWLLTIVPTGPINNILTLVRIVARCRPGDKPLSEPMLVSLPTHIYVTRPQWFKVPKLKQKGQCYYEKAFVVDSSKYQHNNPFTLTLVQNHHQQH